MFTLTDTEPRTIVRGVGACLVERIQSAYPQEKVQTRGRIQCQDIFAQKRREGSRWLQWFAPKRHVATYKLETRGAIYPRTMRSFVEINVDLYVFDVALWIYMKNQEEKVRDELSRASHGMAQVGRFQVLDRYSQANYNY